MEKYFYLDESPLYKDKYIIRLNHDKLPFPNGTNGSYNVFISRVLNLSYTDYLRYARDRLGAELIGKQLRYISVYYDKNQTTDALIKLLNKRMEYIMHEHIFPYEYKEENGSIERIPFQQNNENNN